MSGTDIKSLGSFVWSIAELLRGDLLILTMAQNSGTSAAMIEKH
jgi:hypothetical protein